MARNSDNTPDNTINRITEGTSIQGDIKSDSNIRIDGIFKGNIVTSGRLVIGPSGKVDGSIQCDHAKIEGELEGRISVKDLLSLKNTARVNGKIYTDKLSIESGANFTGECHMGAKVKNIDFGKEGEEYAVSEERTA